MSEIKSSLFKAYDIRGLSPGEIDGETAYRVGQALVAFSEAKAVVVGRDMRATSLALEKEVVRGIRSQGADAIRIGLTTTPMFYFAAAFYELHDAGIMVTASHNPPEYNGFKMVLDDAMPIGQGSGMEEIRDRVLLGELPEKSLGYEVETSVIDAYVSRLNELVAPDSLAPVGIVIDAGNGMAGHVLPRVLKSYPAIKAESLYFDLDGSFPNHEANPIKVETLKDLQDKVRRSGAAFGVAYDGDADRVGIVDENGAVVEAHYVLALLAREFLRQRPGSTVLYDVRSSRVVAETIEEAGGRPLMTRVGHAFIKKTLRETGAVMAGEYSSHFYFKDFYGVECSDLVLLLIAKILTAEKKPLSALIAPFRRYAHSGEINFQVEDKAGVIRSVEESFVKTANSVWREDGIRLDFDDWWFSLRSSNTEPLLRLVVEGRTPDLMQEKRQELEQLILGRK
jgi:phosphomannomutase